MMVCTGIFTIIVFYRFEKGMQIVSNRVVMLILLLLTSPLAAQEESAFENQTEEACFGHLAFIIDAALATKRDGRESIDDLKKSWPESIDESREPYVSMIEILDDVFEHEIEPDMIGVYKMYKADTCWLRWNGFVLKNTSYHVTYPGLLQCRSPNIEVLSRCVSDLATSRIDIKNTDFTKVPQ